MLSFSFFFWGGGGGIGSREDLPTAGDDYKILNSDNGKGVYFGRPLYEKQVHQHEPDPKVALGENSLLVKEEIKGVSKRGKLSRWLDSPSWWGP